MQIDQAIEECHRWVREHADRGPALLDDIYTKQLEADIRFRGQPITTFDPRSRGAIAYRDAAKEVHDGAAS